MKKLFLLFVFCCVAGAASAQYAETVHLKNGSIIRGVIIEQTPNQNLKIQTGDGNVFVYSFDEIEKIAKETESSSAFGRPNYSRSVQGARKPQYQGSVDFGYAVGTLDRLEFSTSHGCLVNPYFYAGAGAGVHYYYDASSVVVPIFADLRANLMKGNIKPFVNFRIGYSVGDAEGLYLSSSVGVSIRRFDIGLGYSLQKAVLEYDYHDPYYGSICIRESVNLSGATFKVGVRF